MGLYKPLDELAAVAREQVYGWNLNHGVATGSLAQCGAGARDEDLTREGRIVDLHEETEILVGRDARDAVADEVDAVTHIVEPSTDGTSMT